MTVSAEARAVMTPMLDPATQPAVTPEMLRDPISLATIRSTAAAMQRDFGDARVARYGVDISETEIGGVPARLVRKTGRDFDGERRMIVNLHGGGFILDSGSLSEAVPLAALTGIPVVSVAYRLAPEHPFPAAVDDALAVYREALENRAALAIGVCGTSAGAVLTLQLLARLKAEGLPMPAAAGLFSGGGDLSMVGDCEAFLPPLVAGQNSIGTAASYCGDTPRDDPMLSPVYGDLAGLPPMMLMSSTRDQLLSHTVLADLALRRAGVDVDLRVYEGMMHAFWSWLECPETDVALTAQATFFTKHLRG